MVAPLVMGGRHPVGRLVLVVSNVLEEQFATLEDVKTMTSSSREQGSTITIEFELNVNVDEAANDVRDRVSRVLNSLPDEAEPPEVKKSQNDEEVILWVNLVAISASDR